MPLATAFAWNRAEFSGAYALGLLVTGVLGVPISYLVDRYSGRILMTLGLIMAGWVFDTLHRYDLAFWLCAGSFVLTALLLLGLPHPARQPGES